MKQTAGKQKVAQSAMPVRYQGLGSGTQGVALVSPVYGVAAVDSQLVQRMASGQPENRTGLPDRLKAGVEQLSGLAMDDVRVHYNSTKPAQLQALAYTQGTEIHVGPGQERYLPHEAWHVVQQAQGRVKPTMQLKGRVSVNDNVRLEHEANKMGVKAISNTDLNQVPRVQPTTQFQRATSLGRLQVQSMPAVLQRVQEKGTIKSHRSIPVGTQVGILKDNGKMYQVEYDNQKYWVEKHQVTLISLGSGNQGSSSKKEGIGDARLDQNSVTAMPNTKHFLTSTAAPTKRNLEKQQQPGRKEVQHIDVSRETNQAESKKQDQPAPLNKTVSQASGSGNKKTLEVLDTLTFNPPR